MWSRIVLALLGACGAAPVDRRPTTEQVSRGAVEAPIPGGTVTYYCGDIVLNDQLTTGGSRITSWLPCWQIHEVASTQREGEPATPKPDRAQAAALARAELAHCRGIPASELDHSPFARAAFENIVPYRQRGVLHGVRIVFKPARGLTAASMKRAIACHRARYAALGNPATYLPEDPTLIEGAVAAVTQRGDRVEVLVRSDSEVIGTIALARARELLSRTATR